MAAIKKQDSGGKSTDELSIGPAVSHGALLTICCFFSYWIITHVLAAAKVASRDDEFLGGMWAVVATVFVFRSRYEESAGALLTRLSATLFSFALCFFYLLIFPFRPLGMAVLLGIGSVVLSLIGRSEDIITAGITTTVVMVVAGMSPEHAWKEPILRLIDTVVGIVVGMAGAWISVELTTRGESKGTNKLASPSE